MDVGHKARKLLGSEKKISIKKLGVEIPSLIESIGPDGGLAIGVFLHSQVVLGLGLKGLPFTGSHS
eukprot:15364652-Ditylum_brightwellii.AAC.2